MLNSLDWINKVIPTFALPIIDTYPLYLTNLTALDESPISEVQMQNAAKFTAIQEEFVSLVILGGHSLNNTRLILVHMWFKCQQTSVGSP